MNNRIRKENDRIIKQFRDRLSFENEREIYQRLSGTGLCPELYRTGEQELETEFIDGITLSRFAEDKADAGLMGEALGRWFPSFAEHTRNESGEYVVLDDCNPRNLLVTDAGIKGIDFEQWHFGTYEESAAAVLGMIRTMDLDEKTLSAVYYPLIMWIKKHPGTDLQTLEDAVTDRIKHTELRRHAMKRIRTSACVILAGGQASRMNGAPKGLLPLNGHTFMDVILHTVQMFDRIAVSANTDDYDGFGYRIIPDLISYRGPLGALHAVLHGTAEDLVLIIPCDTPFLQQETIFRLYGILKDTDDAAVVRCGDTVYPVIGLYRHRILPELEEILEGDHYSMRRLLERVNTVYYDADDPAEFRNVNTPEDLRKITGLL